MKHYDKEEGYIRSIVVIVRNDEDCLRLNEFLQSKGYKSNFRLSLDSKKSVTFYIDNMEKKYFSPGVTAMAAWCSGKRYPLSIDQYIDNYERFMIDNDIDYYHQLIEDNCKNKNN